jgi:small-conductance mechanosensitive channel
MKKPNKPIILASFFLGVLILSFSFSIVKAGYTEDIILDGQKDDSYEIVVSEANYTAYYTNSDKELFIFLSVQFSLENETILFKTNNSNYVKDISEDYSSTLFNTTHTTNTIELEMSRDLGGSIEFDNVGILTIELLFLDVFEEADTPDQGNGGDLFDIIFFWLPEGQFRTNVLGILIITLTLIIGVLFFYFIKKQINKQKEKERIDESTAKNLETLSKISVIFIIFIVLTIEIVQLYGTEEFGIFGTALATATGTVLGFAGINSLGNLIAGIIIMVSRPFVVGDRINYKGKIADVVDIKLIYTILEDINGVRISIPNQNLLKEEIENYGRRKILRREIFITADFGEDPRHVETALLEAAEKFGNILKFPEPRVDIYEFLDFAIKYRLIVYINNSRLIPKFDHDLRKAVYYSCRDYKIDISTPTLISQFQTPEAFKKTSPPPEE